MKLAKQGDIRKALERRKLDSIPHFAAFSFQNLSGFADSSVALATGHLAICGGTGSGKSALLGLMYMCLSPREGVVEAPPRMEGASARLTVVAPGGKFEGNFAPDEPDGPAMGFAPRADLIGLSQRTSDIERFLATADIAVAKEGIAKSELPREMLGLAAFACRKDYTEISFYEFEGPDDQVVPFFEASIGELVYDSRSMSTGELSILYIAWAMQSYDPFSVVLIEEPEAYLPPVSHAAIFILISWAAVQYKLAFAVTTHSSEVASHFTKDAILSIRYAAGKYHLPTTRESKERVLYRLGLSPQRVAVVFVEDRVAHFVLEEFLGQFDFHISAKIELVSRGGLGEIRKSIEGLPEGVESIRFLGVVDGDAKAEVAPWPSAKRFDFLPFVDPMEVELIAAIANSPEKFGAMVGRSAARVEDVLAETAGQDHHDQFQAIAEGLGIPLQDLTRHALHRWQRAAGKKARVRSFVTSLAGKIGVPLSS